MSRPHLTFDPVASMPLYTCEVCDLLGGPDLFQYQNVCKECWAEQTKDPRVLEHNSHICLGCYGKNHKCQKETGCSSVEHGGWTEIVPVPCECQECKGDKTQ